MTGNWIEKFGGWWLVPQPGLPERARVRGACIELSALERLGIGLDEPAKIAELFAFDGATVGRLWLDDTRRMVLALVYCWLFPPISDLTPVVFLEAIVLPPGFVPDEGNGLGGRALGEGRSG